MSFSPRDYVSESKALVEAVERIVQLQAENARLREDRDAEANTGGGVMDIWEEVKGCMIVFGIPLIIFLLYFYHA